MFHLHLQKCHNDFESLAALIEHYTEFSEELECSLSCARVNHSYDWEEIVNKSSRSPQDNKKGPFKNHSWVWILFHALWFFYFLFIYFILHILLGFNHYRAADILVNLPNQDLSHWHFFFFYIYFEWTLCFCLLTITSTF